jgi:hypothetical protein
LADFSELERLSTGSAIVWFLGLAPVAAPNQDTWCRSADAIMAINNWT